MCIRDSCYTVEKDEFSEKNRYEEYPVYLPWEHLPQPDGRVCDEGDVYKRQVLSKAIKLCLECVGIG